MAHVLRVPKFDLSALLAQQNPHLDLRLEAYETSTRNFLKAVSNYTHIAQAEITRRKNGHVHEKKRLADKILSHENETNACKVRELELIAGTLLCDDYWLQPTHSAQSSTGNARRGRRLSYLLRNWSASSPRSRSRVLNWMLK